MDYRCGSGTLAPPQVRDVTNKSTTRHKTKPTPYNKPQTTNQPQTTNKEETMRTKRVPALAVALAVGATSTITPAIVLPTAATAAEGGQRPPPPKQVLKPLT